MKIEFRERRCSRIIRGKVQHDGRAKNRKTRGMNREVEWEKCSRIKEIGEESDSSDTAKERKNEEDQRDC